MQTPKFSKKDLLLCFDAFGTLFAPKTPVAAQYGEIARQHGLSGFSNDQVQNAFKKGFKEESKERPNYGKAVGMAAPEWWGNIIKKTFQPFVTDGLFPSGLIPDLITRFSSKDGYELFPDVLPFFKKLREIKENGRNQGAWPWQRTVIGIITNSDDRVPYILESFGLRVGPRFHPTTGFVHGEDRADVDIDFVVLSYDVGQEKPHPDIFHAASTAARALTTKHFKGEFDLLYVGDEIEKDVVGALDAGWDAILVDREGKHQDSEQGTCARVEIGTGECPRSASVEIVNNIGSIVPRLMAFQQVPKTTFPLKMQRA